MCDCIPLPVSIFQPRNNGFNAPSSGRASPIIFPSKSPSPRRFNFVCTRARTRRGQLGPRFDDFDDELGFREKGKQELELQSVEEEEANSTRMQRNWEQGDDGEEEVVERRIGGRAKSRRRVVKRSGVLAKQVISVGSALSLGFISQLWVDPSNSWLLRSDQICFLGNQQGFFLKTSARQSFFFSYSTLSKSLGTYVKRFVCKQAGEQSLYARVALRKQNDGNGPERKSETNYIIHGGKHLWACNPVSRLRDGAWSCLCTLRDVCRRCGGDWAVPGPNIGLKCESWQVGDVVLVKDEDVLDDELTIVGLETLVGYQVVTHSQQNIGKVRGFSFNINSGAMESLELDSFGISIIPSSLVSTYTLLAEDVVEVFLDTVIVREAAVSRIQRQTKGLWDARPMDAYYEDEVGEYDDSENGFRSSASGGRRRRERSGGERVEPGIRDEELELPMDYL